MTAQIQIMGILNVTPDSFSDGGRYVDPDVGVEKALSLIEQGARIIDIGGESTRPGAQEVDADEEMNRVVPVIRALSQTLAEKPEDYQALISVDTRKSRVATAAVEAGAHIWNDVSALTFDADSPIVAARLDCPVILMHAQGLPETMQDDPQYDDAVMDIAAWLMERAEAAIGAGVKREHIILDPGIGFGKRLEHNLAIFRHLDHFKSFGYPLLMGASRKSFMKAIDGSDAQHRLGGSLAAALWSVAKGADILRVHDVYETAQAVKVWSAIGGA